VKLRAFAQRNPGRLPLPKALMITPASEHDLTAAKQVMRDFCPISCGTLYADKAYIDVEWAQLLDTEYDIHISTPRKKRRGDALCSGDTFSTFVSMRRQPIECFFYWLNFHTSIQIASKARTLPSLLLNILAAWLLPFSCFVSVYPKTGSGVCSADGGRSGCIPASL